jgi:ApaG protein
LQLRIAPLMTQSPDSDTVTRGIRVQASAQYVPDQSEPDQDQYFFAYRIQISNESEQKVKLLSRHWIIIDADNEREEVRGPGVVGEQPELAPGERFEYTSACPLTTRWGTMEGTYSMQTGDGEAFDVAVGRFFLVSEAARRGVTT